VIELVPAAERCERWWPAALAIIVAADLRMAMSARYRVQPAWVVPAVLLALLAVPIARGPGPRRPAENCHRTRAAPGWPAAGQACGGTAQGRPTGPG
jgi:hypothetical protein